MPVIAFVSPKGGVGKTTAATILATQLARGSRVTMIDADPNKPVLAWSKLANVPDAISVVADVSQETLIDTIEAAAANVPFVVVDCEGTASLTVAYAIGAADLVVVPTQGSQLDARQATKALALIRNTEKQLRRPILHAVLFTRTNPAIRTRTLGAVEQQLAEHGVRVMLTRLHEREAFRAMFSFGGGLDTLPAEHVANRERAVANARAFAAEVVELLREGEGRGQADSGPR